MDKYTIFYSNDCMMWGVEFPSEDGQFRQQALPPKGKGGRRGQSAYTYYKGVAERWARELNNNK